MNNKEFLGLCKYVYSSDNTGSYKEAEIFFRSVWIGYYMPRNIPPKNSDIAEEGYKLGVKISKEEKSRKP